MIEGKSDEPSEERDVTSHFKPICAAIYNDLFNQVSIMLNFTPKGPPEGERRAIICLRALIADLVSLQ